MTGREKIEKHLSESTYKFEILGEDTYKGKTTYAIVEFTPWGSRDYYFLNSIGDQIFNEDGTNLEDEI